MALIVRRFIARALCLSNAERSMSEVGSAEAHILFDTFPYMVSIAVPSAWNALSAAMEISEATSAYSIALAPLSHRIIRINRNIAHSLVNKGAAGVARVRLFSLAQSCRMLA